VTLVGGGRIALDDRALERVSEGMHGANEARTPRIVAEGVAQLRHYVREVGLVDEGGGPQPRAQVLLGHGLRPALQKRPQQLEGLGREMDGHALPPELPPVRIEHARPEAQRHRPHYRAVG